MAFFLQDGSSFILQDGSGSFSIPLPVPPIGLCNLPCQIQVKTPIHQFIDDATLRIYLESQNFYGNSNHSWDCPQCGYRKVYPDNKCKPFCSSLCKIQNESNLSKTSSPKSYPTRPLYQNIVPQQRCIACQTLLTNGRPFCSDRCENNFPRCKICGKTAFLNPQNHLCSQDCMKEWDNRCKAPIIPHVPVPVPVTSTPVTSTPVTHTPVHPVTSINCYCCKSNYATKGYLPFCSANCHKQYYSDPAHIKCAKPNCNIPCTKAAYAPFCSIGCKLH
jgi:endogenous inhibitor of DNA gyrase (YacG/DUF329 family)